MVANFGVSFARDQSEPTSEPSTSSQGGATPAASVERIVGKDNELFQPSGGGMLVNDLMAHFGIKGSVSQRAATLLKAAGLTQRYGGYVRLGEPALLVSTRRRRIIDLRKRYTAIAAENA